MLKSDRVYRLLKNSTDFEVLVIRQSGRHGRVEEVRINDRGQLFIRCPVKRREGEPEKPSGSAAFFAEQAAEFALDQHPYEGAVGDQIAFPHAAWFLDNAIQPFQTGFLHPFRCSLHLACHHIKSYIPILF